MINLSIFRAYALETFLPSQNKYVIHYVGAEREMDFACLFTELQFFRNAQYEIHMFGSQEYDLPFKEAKMAGFAEDVDGKVLKFEHGLTIFL